MKIHIPITGVVADILQVPRPPHLAIRCNQIMIRDGKAQALAHLPELSRMQAVDSGDDLLDVITRHAGSMMHDNGRYRPIGAVKQRAAAHTASPTTAAIQRDACTDKQECNNFFNHLSSPSLVSCYI